MTVTLFVMLIALSACNGCFGTTTKKVANDAGTVNFVPKLVKGRILLDPEFSGPERLMIAKALKMWTDPLSEVVQMEIAHDEDTIDEVREERTIQQMVIEQERVAAGITDPEDEFNDPHDSWDPFDPRMPIWSVENGCTSRVRVVRMSSWLPRIRMLDATQGGPFVGWTALTCHDKAILIITDRIKDEKEFVGVVAHEFGHMFGLKHDFRRNESVMYPGEYSSSCVTFRDIEAFCDRWKCPKTIRLRAARSCN